MYHKSSKSFITLIFTLILFSTQLNAQNVSDVVPSLNTVAGLVNLPVTKIVTKPTYVRGNITIHGKKSLLVGFKVNDKKMGAVLFSKKALSDNKGITLGDIVPSLKGKPTDDVILNKVAFIFVPSGNAQTNVDVTLLPTLVQNMIDSSVSTVNLDVGLNIFSQAAVKSTSKLATMLTKVGAYKDAYSLIGTLSPKIFNGGSATTLKNDILDGINLHIKLPKVSFSGIPSKMVSITNSKLAITTKTTKGVREIDLDIHGDLITTVNKHNVDFTYKMIFTKIPNKPIAVSIKAKATQGSTISFDLIETMTLSDLSFDIKKKGTHWYMKVTGDTTFRSENVSMDFYYKRGEDYASIDTNMTLSKALGHSSIPALDDISISNVRMYPSSKKMDVKAVIKNQDADISVFKLATTDKKYHMALMFDNNFTADTFIPDASSTPLKDVTLEKLTFLYNPTTTNETFELSSNDSVATALEDLNTTSVPLKAGLNLFGHMKVKPTGEMANLLKGMGVSSFTLPLNGKFSPKAFAKSHSASNVKKEILSNLDLHVKLPALDIPGVDDVLKFSSGALKVKGNTAGTGFDIKISGDADIKIKQDNFLFDVAIDYTKTGSTYDFDFSSNSTETWVHPLGIGWLTLDNVSLNIDKTNASGTKVYDVNVSAKTNIGTHENLDVDVHFDDTNGVITNTYFELTDSVDMGEIPRIKNIPHADKFTLDNLMITEHGLQASTTLGSNDFVFYAFHTENGWNTALTQTNFKLTELIPPFSKVPLLNEIKFPHLAVILSEGGINESYSSLSKVGRDAMKHIFADNNDTNINIKEGLALIAGFHPDNTENTTNGKKLKKHLNKIGITSGTIIIGEIGGLFGGTPSVMLKGELSALGDHSSMPSSIPYTTGEDIFVLLNVVETGEDYVLEVGLGIGVTTTIKSDKLTFDASVFVKDMEEGIGIDIEGSMDGHWQNPLGIPAFTLDNVTILAGVEDDGVNLGFAGKADIAGDTFSMASAATFTEAAGIPQDIALMGTADEIPMLFLEQVATNMMGKAFNFNIPNEIFPVFKNADFVFVSPGGSAPTLGMTSEGFGMSGSMNWLKHDVGDMNLSITTHGIHAAGDIDDFHLGGVLKLKDNKFSLDAGLGVPKMKLDSNIDFLGISEKVEVKAGASGITVESDIELTTDMQLKSDFTLSEHNFNIDGNLSMNIGKFITQPAGNIVIDLLDKMNKAFAKAEKKLARAQHKVDHLTTEINKKRAALRKKRAAAESKVKNAEKKVNDLESSINEQWAKYHRCHGWFDKWPCRIEHGIEIAGLKAAKDVADAALTVAEDMISHFPLDFDPEIAALIVAKKTATGLLDIAKYAVEGADIIEHFIKEGVEKIEKDMANEINIKQALFSADVATFVEGKSPVKVSIDAELFSHTIDAGIAMKLAHIEKDLAYDLKRMELMAYYALHYAVEHALHVVPKPLRDKLKSAISGGFKKAQDANNAEIKAHNLTATAESDASIEMKAEYSAFSKKALIAQVKKPNPLNHEKSEIFKDELIEVGHTGLCLENVNGEIRQKECHNSGNRWSTVPVSGAPGVKYGAGYVNIQDKNGKCVVPNGTWANVNKTFADINFTVSEFTGDSTVSVKQCINTKQYYWKVLKHGDGWMQMANLATNECLHFDENSAIPLGAKAVWKPCVGSANQIFRVADSDTPTYHKAGIAMRNDQLGQCLGNGVLNDSNVSIVPMVDCSEAARYDYMVNMEGDLKFINTRTGNCLKPSGYAIGADLTDVPCTQLDYQWWEAQEFAGGILIKNAQTQQCTQPPSDLSKHQAKQVDCKNRLNSIFTPLKDATSGPNWKVYDGHYSSTGVPTKFIEESKRFHPDPIYKNVVICSINTPSGFAAVNGFAPQPHKLAQCIDGRTDQTKRKFRVLMKSKGMEWVSNNGNKIPNRAIVTGGFNQEAVYTCKTSANGAVAAIGWTADGKTCNTSSNPVSGSFEILSRTQAAHYKLDMTNGSENLRTNPVSPYISTNDIAKEGWTKVWEGRKADYDSKMFKYNVSDEFIKNSSDTLIAYEINGYLESPYSFTTPNQWKKTHPFTVQGETVRVDTKDLISGKDYNGKSLKFGYGNFNDKCSDAFKGGSLGRVCIEDTKAPFYSGFNKSGDDTCSNSSEAYDATKCSSKKFVIYMKQNREVTSRGLVDNGWTQVWKATQDNYNARSFQYDVSSEKINTYTKTIIAYDNNGKLEDAYEFDTPNEWKSKHPFSFAGNSAMIDTTELSTGKEFTDMKMNFGYKDFKNSCSDEFITGNFGKLCIEDTKAPFFDGFNTNQDDSCNNSSEDHNTSACGNGKFVMFMKDNRIEEFNESEKEFITFNSKKIKYISGWSHLEKNHIWSIGNTSLSLFELEDRNYNGTLLLDVGSLGKQTIEVYINDTKISTYQLPKKNKVFIKFNPDILKPNAVNTIKFEYSNPHRPSNGDQRILAMSLKSLSIGYTKSSRMEEFVKKEKELYKLEKEGITFDSKKIKYISGWSHPENNHIWSIGNTSSLSLKLEDKNYNGSLLLNIGSLGKQTIGVYINNTKVSTYKLPTNDKVLIKFNPNILKPNAVNTIRFEYSNPHRPSNGDQRILAMSLKALSIGYTKKNNMMEEYVEKQKELYELEKEPITFNSKKIKYISGWSHPEAHHIWSIGNTSSLSLELEDRNYNGTLLLNISSLGKQTIEVYINDTKVSTYQLPTNDKVFIKFNPYILNPNEVNTIRFKYSNPHRPSDADQRILAMSFKSLSLGYTKSNREEEVKKAEKKLIAFNSEKIKYTSGWSHPEKKHIWSIGKTSSLSLNLENRYYNGTLLLNVASLGKQAIKVYINNTYISTYKLPKKDKVFIKFNPNILKLNDINTIRFEYSNPHKPSNGDQRILAMSLKSLSIE